MFRTAMGGFLIVYTLFRLLVLPNLSITGGGKLADSAVGWGGGVLSGLAGIPGPLTTVWCGLKNWSKDAQRAVYQPFNQTMILLALGGYALQGLLTWELAKISLYCIPASLAGMVLGLAGYKRLDDAQFKKIILWLLLFSGLSLTFFRN